MEGPVPRLCTSKKRRDEIGIQVTKGNLRTANLEIGKESRSQFRLLLESFRKTDAWTIRAKSLVEALICKERHQ
jgi:hypothetical protein